MVECCRGGTFSVNLALKTCGCKKWDLSGIPCVHAMRAIGSQGLAVEDYVDRCKCQSCGEEGHNAITCKRKNLTVDREVENEDVRGTQQTVIDDDGFPTQQFTPGEGSSSQNQRQPSKKLKPIRKEKGKSTASAPFKPPLKALKKKSVPMSFQTMAAAQANVSRQAAESINTSKPMSFQQTSTEDPTPTPANPNASLFQTTTLVQQLIQQHANEIGGSPSIGPVNIGTVNFVGSAINMNVETRPKKGNGGKKGKKATK